MKCPFCPLLRLSPWCLQTDDGIIVAKDLNSKHYKYRLLVVGSGRKWHLPIQLYSEEEIDRFVDLGTAIARRHIKQGRATRIAEIDKKHLKYPDHWHLQICVV